MNNDQLLVADGEYEFLVPPKYVGTWEIGGNWHISVLKNQLTNKLKILKNCLDGFGMMKRHKRNENKP